jgi:serine protease Do
MLPPVMPMRTVAFVLALLGGGLWGLPAAQAQTAPSAADTSVAPSRRTAITRAVKQVSPSVVTVNVEETQRVRDPRFAPYDDAYVRYFLRQSPYREERVQGTGSGFVVSPDGYVVTNEHVVGTAGEIEVLFPDGRSMPATRVGSDEATDLAVLKVEPTEALPYVQFDTSSAPIVGEWVIAFGNPFGLFEATQPSVSVGVVSATGRDLRAEGDGRLYRDMIQTAAAVNQGNSGGPLVNAEGQVIGVNTAIYSDTGGSIGLGFAVPAARAARIVSELRERGAVDRSYYTGLATVSVTSRIARALDLPRNDGVLVHDFDDDSPAAEAGLQLYDVIVEVEGTPVRSRADYIARLYDFRPGDTIRLRVLRDGSPTTVPLRIGRRE